MRIFIPECIFERVESQRGDEYVDFPFCVLCLVIEFHPYSSNIVSEGWLSKYTFHKSKWVLDDRPTNVVLWLTELFDDRTQLLACQAHTPQCSREFLVNGEEYLTQDLIRHIQKTGVGRPWRRGCQRFSSHGGGNREVDLRVASSPGGGDEGVGNKSPSTVVGVSVEDMVVDVRAEVRADEDCQSGGGLKVSAPRK